MPPGRSIPAPTSSEAISVEKDAQVGIGCRRPQRGGRHWSWSYLLLILCPALCADAFWIAFHPLTGLYLLICFSLLSAMAVARADRQPATGGGRVNRSSSVLCRESDAAAAHPNRDFDPPGGGDRCNDCANIARLIAMMERVRLIFWAALLTGPLVAIWCVIAAVSVDPDVEIGLTTGSALGLAVRMPMILLSFSAILAQVMTLTANRGVHPHATSCPIWALSDCSDSRARLLSDAGDRLGRPPTAAHARPCLYWRREKSGKPSDASQS
jgi:hypothetical protein